jgi:hypothetical protein
LSTSSMYSPIWDKAITAVYLYLQSLFTNSFSMVADRMGNNYCSPMVYINLSIAPIPKRVVSKSSSSSMSSLYPYSGFIHSSLTSLPISTIWKKIISITD